MIKMLICRCNLRKLQTKFDFECKDQRFESKYFDCFSNEKHKYYVAL